MIKGPTLQPNQFAALMTDGATGHVLSTDEEVYLSDGKDVYLIFENIEEARQFVDNLNKRNDTIEITIYDSSYELVEYSKVGQSSKKSKPGFINEAG